MVQAVAQGFKTYSIDDFTYESTHQELACLGVANTALLHIEEGILIELTHGGSVTTLHVIGIDLELRLGVHTSLACEADPEADPADGMLDILLVDKVSLMQVPGLIGKYKNGLYKQISHVAHYMKANCVKVLSKVPTAVNLDGETLFAREVVMKLAEEKIRFFYPRGLTWAPKVTANA